MKGIKGISTDKDSWLPVRQRRRLVGAAAGGLKFARMKEEKL
jgi:hypothetical protein